MNAMLNTMPVMSWAMLTVWLLVAVILILGVAALVKYLFSPIERGSQSYRMRLYTEGSNDGSTFCDTACDPGYLGDAFTGSHRRW